MRRSEATREETRNQRLLFGPYLLTIHNSNFVQETLCLYQPYLFQILNDLFL